MKKRTKKHQKKAAAARQTFLPHPMSRDIKNQKTIKLQEEGHGDIVSFNF